MIRLVNSYLRFTEGEPIPVEDIDTYATGEFEKWLNNTHGMPIRFPARMPFKITSVRPVRDDGSLLIANVSVDAGTVPMFGPWTIEWVFFGTPVEEKGLRLNGLRRQKGIEDVAGELRYLDTSSLYPSTLKPLIAHESSRLLLSNSELRRNFLENRKKFQALVSHFTRRDSLYMMARVDRVVSQLNQFSIMWGDGAQYIPQEAFDEFLRKLPEADREEMRIQFRAAERARKNGMDSLASIARRLGYDMSRIDTTLNLMRDVRVSFINSRLPWKGAVQFTVGGKFDDVLGYLYSPNGEVPLVSPDEYYYVEEIGEGWWIFRAT